MGEIRTSGCLRAALDEPHSGQAGRGSQTPRRVGNTNYHITDFVSFALNSPGGLTTHGASLPFLLHRTI